MFKNKKFEAIFIAEAAVPCPVAVLGGIASDFYFDYVFWKLHLSRQ